MMADILPWLGNLLVLTGACFMLTGAIGMLRMPDFFCRLHPAGLKDSMGVPLVIFGLMLHAGWTLISIKLLLLLVFHLFTSPTACHAVARAALLITHNRHSRASQLDMDDSPSQTGGV
jgi:multicomponent Na+:H+ antiporter subunit G